MNVSNIQVLDGVSASPPSLVGNDEDGILLAWMDQDQIWLSTSVSTPPFQSRALNPAWNSSDTPALALAPEWENVYLAWTDDNGAVYLANSANGWKNKIAVTTPNAALLGPALAFGNDLLFIAWRGYNSLLTIATCDRNGEITRYDTEFPIFSRPSLTWSDGSLYALSGGNLVGEGDSQMCIFQSTDNGQSFEDLSNYVERYSCLGPPSLCIVGEYYYLVFADAKTSQLYFAVTKQLEYNYETPCSIGCHNGGPTLIALSKNLVVGWSYGANSQDPKAHHITIGDLPLSELCVSLPEVEQENSEGSLRLPPAPNPCPDPFTVYDPVNNRCVPRGGCAGKCVLEAYTVGPPPFVLPVFNPIKYAWCIFNC